MYLYFCSSRYTEYTHLRYRAGEIFFFWQLGLVTVGDALFSLLLREDSSQVVTVDAVTINNELPLCRSTGYLDSALALQNAESAVAVRQALTALYYAYPTKADVYTTRITRRLLVSPAQPVYFYVRVETDPTSTLL